MMSKVGMARDYLRFLILAELCGFWTFSATAATSIFSDYGQIQNVQNYSTNPFWSPNSPYNQRLPQPVYVQGADLNADDCTSVVQSLVSAQCMARNNCKDTALSDIRPTIMVQLANLPGANYVSACSGYLDYIFETYKQQNGNKLPNRKTAFPTATTPNPNANNTNGVQLKNPYKVQSTKWQQDIKGRADELAELQKQNGSDSYALSATSFPKTYEDLSFTERIENERAGLMPYKDLQPYVTPDIKNIAEWCSEKGHQSTQACIKFKDCTAIAKEKDKRVAKAEYDDGRVKCNVIECIAGFVPKSNKQGCMDEPGKDCTAEMKKKDEHVTGAEYDEKGKCIVTRCEASYEPNETKDGCKLKDGSNCTTGKPHEDVAKMQGGICVIETCKDGYTANSDGSACECVAPEHAKAEEIPGTGTPPGPDTCVFTCDPPTEYRKTPDGTACEPMPSGECTPTAPHATAGQYDTYGECKITECERFWHPATDGKSCEEDTTYYTMDIYSDIYLLEGITNYSTDKGVDPRQANKCYSVCGIHSGADDVNAKLNSILGKKYCVPRNCSETNSCQLQEIGTTTVIKFTQQEKDLIVSALNSIMGTGNCNMLHVDPNRRLPGAGRLLPSVGRIQGYDAWEKITAEISECTTATNSCTSFYSIIIDPYD